jgi:hypothetical protein
MLDYLKLDYKWLSNLGEVQNNLFPNEHELKQIVKTKILLFLFFGCVFAKF